jgi:hypothetical protein
MSEFPTFVKKKPTTQQKRVVEHDDPKPKVEKHVQVFSAAFWAAWPDFKQSVESVFKKWPAKRVEWQIIKQEVEKYEHD